MEKIEKLKAEAEKQSQELLKRKQLLLANIQKAQQEVQHIHMVYQEMLVKKVMLHHIY
jgi:hypothetical protein